jgi:hypothetical protein
METVFWPVLSAALILALGLGALWINRARHARRFRLTMDAYAEQQLAQEHRWK